jgi:hypothetical protein
MKTLALLALILFNLTVRSQTVSSYVINSSGSYYSQGRYNIDWSIGELALVETMQSNGSVVILTNGFLQPNLSDNTDSSTRHRFTNSEIRIMPNPTHGKVEVNFSIAQKGTLHLYVYDANGKLLRTNQLLNNGIMMSKSVDLTPFSSGTYLLRIELDALPGSVSKTGSYKIIKL